MSNNTDDKETFFVSRRGRNIGVHQVDLSGIDIDDTLISSKATPRTVRPQKPSRSTRFEGASMSRMPDKRRIILALMIIGIIAVPLGIAEAVTAQYSNAPKNAFSQLDSLVQSDVLPLQKKAAVSSVDIDRAAKSVDEIASKMCRGGLLDNIASIYPRASKAHDRCKATQSHYAALVSSLYVLRSQASYLERVDKALKPATTPITDAFAVIDAQQSIWLTAADEIKKITPPPSLKDAHAELSLQTSSAAADWAKLSAANNDQNASEFTAAEEGLTTAYESLRASSTMMSAAINTQQQTVTTAYSALR